MYMNFKLTAVEQISLSLSLFFCDTFFFLIVVDFVIHWNETAMGLHVFPISVSLKPLIFRMRKILSEK